MLAIFVEMYCEYKLINHFRGFAQGESVSGMETGKSRIVLKKIEEPSWWIVAVSIFITLFWSFLF